MRFLGYDGMFEIRFFMDIDVLTKGPCPGSDVGRALSTGICPASNQNSRR
ncbi:hypothetical protein [Rhizobium sp. BK377]|nr:hypothetical protein [Rhizobium sp. BK377]